MALPVCTFMRTPRHLSKCVAHVNTLHMRAMRLVCGVLLLPAHPPVDPESPPLGCWSSAQIMTDHERASRRADAAGATTLFRRHGLAIGFGATRMQPWLLGDMPRSGIFCVHAPCPVVECVDESAAQHVWRMA